MVYTRSNFTVNNYYTYYVHFIQVIYHKLDIFLIKSKNNFPKLLLHINGI